MGQKRFTAKYVERLKDNLDNGVDLDLYKLEQFPIETSMVKDMLGIEERIDYISQLNHKDNCASAIALYNSYPDLPLTLASSEEFWSYLTHVTCYKYVKQCWPKYVDEDGNIDAKYIKEHWFKNSHGWIGSTLAGLWWSVYCSIDESNQEDTYELTKILFSNETFRTRVFCPQMIGNKGLMLGILDFLKENPEFYQEHAEARLRYVARFINSISAYTCIEALSRSDIKEKLMSQVITIQNITNTKDIGGLTLEDIQALI